jgi:8-oxo-dGTP pyrophosphatase MutT (NUDIX family)
VILDPDGAVLLVRAHTAVGVPYWFTPGGGIEPGEDPDLATRREIAEETDINVPSIGPVILRRRARLVFLGEYIEVDETFHAIWLEERPNVQHRQLEQYEADSFTGLHWLTPAEMRAQPHRIYPLCLPDLVDAVCAGAVDEPWEELDLYDDVDRVDVIKPAT